MEKVRKDRMKDLFFVLQMVVVSMLIAIILGSLVSCASLMAKPSYCEGVTDSLICAKIPNPQVADLAIQLGSIQVIKEGVYSKAEFLEFLTNARKFVEQVTTYDGIFRYLNDKLKVIPPELVVLSQGMISFEGVLVPVTSTDRGFILAHIDHVTAAVMLVKEN